MQDGRSRIPLLVGGCSVHAQRQADRQSQRAACAADAQGTLSGQGISVQVVNPVSGEPPLLDLDTILADELASGLIVQVLYICTTV